MSSTAISTHLEFHGPMQLAQQLAKSNIVPKALRGKAADILVIILTGQEFGIAPMQAMRAIHVIDGKPELAAEFMAALILASPVCDTFDIITLTNQKCVVRAKRKGDTEPRDFEYTMDDAKAAGLAGKDNWRKHAKSMLRSRAVSHAARGKFPDVIRGAYTIGEISDRVETEAGEVIEAVAEVVNDPPQVDTDAPTQAEDLSDDDLIAANRDAISAAMGADSPGAAMAALRKIKADLTGRPAVRAALRDEYNEAQVLIEAAQEKESKA